MQTSKAIVNAIWLNPKRFTEVIYNFTPKEALLKKGKEREAELNEWWFEC